MERISNVLKETEKGIIINVKLVPNSSFSRITDFTKEYVRIKISSPPIDNRANNELILFCARLFDVNKSKIEIVSGEKSKIKKVLIKNSTIEDISKKLANVLNDLIEGI